MEGSRSNRGLKQFVQHELWTLQADSYAWPIRILLTWFQQLLLVLRNFHSDRCFMRASALAYTSLLGLVPFLALVFSVLKGLGVQNQLEPLLMDQLAVGGQEAVSAVIGYINNTNVARLGTFGLILLLISVYSLLSKIEESFNAVCGMTKSRSPFRRFADYFSVGLIGPIFLVAAVSMTTTLKSQAFLQQLLAMEYVGQVILFWFKIVPFVVMWLAFILMYTFLPNMRIRWRAALVGGVIGGTLWQFAQYGYIGLQVGVAKYNAIYGTLAALPILMVWIHLSWIIVLFGLEIVYVIQNFQTMRQELRQGELSYEGRERLAMTVLLRVTGAFERGEPAVTLETLSRELDMPTRPLHELLERMENCRLLAEVNMDDGLVGFQPAQAPDSLMVSEVVHRLRREGLALETRSGLPELEVAQRLAEELAQCLGQHYGQKSLSELSRQLEAGEGVSS